jgi:hypothetical protein
MKKKTWAKEKNREEKKLEKLSSSSEKRVSKKKGKDGTYRESGFVFNLRSFPEALDTVEVRPLPSTIPL